MRTLHRSVVVKRELSRKAKLSIYRSIFVPTLTYGHELWVMTERTNHGDRVRSSAIREELGVESLLLRVERGQMGWLGHLVRMPPGTSLVRCSGHVPPVRDPRETQDTLERLCLSTGLGTPGDPSDELEEVAGEREVWASLLRLLPAPATRPRISGREWMDGWIYPELLMRLVPASQKPKNYNYLLRKRVGGVVAAPGRLGTVIAEVLADALPQVLRGQGSVQANGNHGEDQGRLHGHPPYARVTRARRGVAGAAGNSAAP
ncbi:Proton-coupled folate transporter Heme carrier protein 1 PCFT/HCP1 [Takifugu flavidus]|uniref:Proton-coupled folate transporter Heme carrier protein 1 PCFT/HCP1 n=1 Tax=Takifugu flavidus TaxID=433684 RepID=A0A5C6PGH1_9TELE|nr:Proton-coupled folate transporter Heme carrier protein 1 PCFT/HCP1 [Takifugu flavidus]